MPEKPEIVESTKENLGKYKIACFIKEKDPVKRIKEEWFIKRSREGLKIKLLYLNGRVTGYIEYVPGEYAWRAVDAKGYMFIHCIWTTPKKIQKKGYGSMLIKEVEKDAKGMNGVAVLVSDGPFMATKEVFLKNGYKDVATNGKESILVKQFKKAPLPEFKDHQKALKKYGKGLYVIYSDQCPWVTRFITEAKDPCCHLSNFN